MSAGIDSFAGKAAVRRVERADDSARLSVVLYKMRAT